MDISRRKTIKILGGGVILAAISGLGLNVLRSPDKALEPWGKAGLDQDPRKRALSYAILAPNPHNRQPWMVDLTTQNQVKLYVDTNRLLPYTDPFNRQITIGLGCFLEVMRIAALKDGYDVKIAVFPDGASPDKLDTRLVAVADFVARDGVAFDPLFDQILERRSVKEPYDLAKPVTDEVLKLLSVAAIHGTVVGTTNEESKVLALRKLCHEAFLLEIETPHTYKESVDLFRIGASEIDANPDGIAFSGPLFETMQLAGMFSRAAALDKSSMTYSAGLKAGFANTDTAMAHIWLTTSGNSREEQITAGYDWVRINLAATALGVATQPMSQALQEYPEMKMFYDEAHKIMAPKGSTLQMFGRLGYAPRKPASPRWPLEAKIINA